MTPSRCCLIALAFFVLLICLTGPAHAQDEDVAEAMSLAARKFDGSLPDQPVAAWLRSHVPARYDLVWGEQMTDCGEGTGTAVDSERDMPVCLEVEIKEGQETKGYLSLFVGTEKRGLSKDGCGLYFGFLEDGGRRYIFKRLSDVLGVQ